MVGYPRTPYFSPSFVSTVASTFASRISESSSFSVAAAFAHSGASALQWPHHGASTTGGGQSGSTASQRSVCGPSMVSRRSVTGQLRVSQVSVGGQSAVSRQSMGGKSLGSVRQSLVSQTIIIDIIYFALV